jgi:phage terminase large subunit-like protein
MSKKKKNSINEAAANRALNFIQSLKQSKGRWAGCPLILMDWQKDFIAKLFGTLNPDGTRQYRKAALFVPRKNGKTEITAGIGNYGLFADGEMGGEIYTAAADRGQASIIYNEAAYMVRTSPALDRRATVNDSVKRIIVPSTHSILQALSAESYTKHGLGPHMVLFDELHAQPNRDLWDVLNTGSGAREQPLTLAITTAGVDRESICYEVYKYACRVRDGEIDDPTFLPVIYEAAEGDNWEDEKVWAKANPALGVFRSVEEIREKYRQAKETPAFEMTFRQLYLNQWVSSYERWLPMDKWDACGAGFNPGTPWGQPDIDKYREWAETFKGRDCYAGLDLASTTDLTALSLVFPDGEGSFSALPHFWIPLDSMIEAAKRDRVPYPLWLEQGLIHATVGNIIDYTAVEATIDELAKIYRIKEIAFDNWNAGRLSQDLTDKGYTMVPFSQSVKNMSPPTKELMNITLSGKLHHGGNPVLRWNADNMMVYRDSNDNLKPNKQKATGRIDGMVALIMGLDRAIRHEAKSEPSVYETRGVISF